MWGVVKHPELAQQRRDRAEEADRLLRQFFSTAVGYGTAAPGMALVAVGGYGRAELSPHSDLDVVLVHDPAVPADRVESVANAIWYPMWDLKLPLDHSVRSTVQMREMAAKDHRAAMGMLDARPVAGDSGLVLALRSEVLADWRRDARTRLQEVRELRNSRIERSGAVAHSAIPDLKESAGGLRDSISLRAMVATWLIDVPHAEAETLRTALLDVRDALHLEAGRRTDKLSPELLVGVAERLDVAPIDLDLHVRDVGRRIEHLTTRAWRAVDDVLGRPGRRPQRRPGGPLIELVSPGVGVLDREVVITREADPRADPEVVLRAAATAAQRGLPINQASLDRLSSELGPVAEPWRPTAHRLLNEFLGSGRRMIDVWEQLDFAGIIDAVLPEWAGIRLRGSSSPVHRFTVDRHSLEACANADELNRSVARPDLLAVAALLHDVGKGRPGDHSQVGEPMVVDIVLRWGFSEQDAEIVGRLVRWHLLLPTIATNRDIEDPHTAANVAEIVETTDFLDLLEALTACDALATGPSAWTGWRRGLIEGLSAKVRAHLSGVEPTGPITGYEGWPAHVPIPPAGEFGPADFTLQVEPHQDGSLLTIVSANRPGVLADLAGALSLAGLQIRSARMVTVGDATASLWEVTRPGVDAKVLTERIRPALAGDVDLAARLTYSLSRDEYEPRVTVLDAMEQTATLLEVRTLDRRALMWTVCHTIAVGGYNIRSAHLNTYGDEARDVFYITDGEGLALYDAEAALLRDRVHAALA